MKYVLSLILFYIWMLFLYFINSFTSLFFFKIYDKREISGKILEVHEYLPKNPYHRKICTAQSCWYFVNTINIENQKKLSLIKRNDSIFKESDSGVLQHFIKKEGEYLLYQEIELKWKGFLYYVPQD